ncbi:MAG TPA: acyltransferase domain-containing protein [Chthoniobacterales bacterium]
MEKVIWMCAGQGTQFYQMGRELYEQEPVFRRFMDRGDELVRELINESLVDIVYLPRANRFDPFRRLLHTHPAILLFQCALAHLLAEKGFQPDLLLGYSLGEFAALSIGGALPFEQALINVIKQAELIEYCVAPGGMLAILDSIDLTERHPEVFHDCTVAGCNFERNFLIAASLDALPKVQHFLRRNGVNFLDLPVDYAFHSPAMDAVKTAVLSLLEALTLAPPPIPVVSAQNGKVLEPPSAKHLWQAMRDRVDFASAIRNLEKTGPYLYLDLSPSGSMATTLKYLLPKQSRSEFLTVSSSFGQERKNLQRVLERCRAAGLRSA